MVVKIYLFHSVAKLALFWRHFLFVVLAMVFVGIIIICHNCSHHCYNFLSFISLLVQEIRKQREQQRLLRQQEKVHRQQQIRLERELRTQQVIEVSLTFVSSV